MISGFLLLGFLLVVSGVLIFPFGSQNAETDAPVGVMTVIVGILCFAASFVLPMLDPSLDGTFEKPKDCVEKFCENSGYIWSQDVQLSEDKWVRCKDGFGNMFFTKSEYETWLAKQDINVCECDLDE